MSPEIGLQRREVSAPDGPEGFWRQELHLQGANAHGRESCGGGPGHRKRDTGHIPLRGLSWEGPLSYHNISKSESEPRTLPAAVQPNCTELDRS